MRNDHARAWVPFVLSYVLMALIPTIVCLVFFYPNTRREIEDNVRRDAQMDVNWGIRNIDRQLMTLYNLPSLFLNNPQISRREIEERPRQNLTLSTEIRHEISGNMLILDAFLYSRAQNYLFSGYHSNVSRERNEKFAGSIGLQYENWSQKDMFETFDTLYGTQVRPAEAVTIEGEKNNQVVTFLFTLPIRNRYAYATMAVLVSGERFSSMFAGEGINSLGYLLYDESGTQILRVGLEGEEFPQIGKLFSDKEKEEGSMELEGRTLLSWARSENTGWTLVKVTSLVGTRAQIKDLERKVLLIALGLSVVLGGLGYCFMQLNYRPLYDILQQLKAKGQMNRKRTYRIGHYNEIENAIHLLWNDNVRLKGDMESLIPMLRRNCILELLTKTGEEAHLIKQELEKLGIRVNLAFYQVVLISGPADGEISGEIRKEDFELRTDLVDIIRIPRTDISLFLFGGGREEIEADLKELPLRSGVFEQAGIGIGRAVEDIADIASSYSFAYTALDYAVIQGERGKGCWYDELPEALFKTHSYPFHVIQGLASTMLRNDREGVRKLTEQIIYMIRMKELPSYYIRSLFYNAAGIYIDKRRRSGREDEKDVPYISTQLSSWEMADLLKALLEEYLKDLSELEDLHSVPLARALSFINENYQSSGLSLADVAEHCGMTASYLSYLFKEKSGSNFKEYIDGLRLERAKHLLNETDMKVEEIARAVGYENSYSFTRFFKNNMGLTPKEFRALK